MGICADIVVEVLSLSDIGLDVLLACVIINPVSRLDI